MYCQIKKKSFFAVSHVPSSNCVVAVQSYLIHLFMHKLILFEFERRCQLLLKKYPIRIFNVNLLLLKYMLPPNKVLYLEHLSSPCIIFKCLQNIFFFTHLTAVWCISFDLLLLEPVIKLEQFSNIPFGKYSFVHLKHCLKKT